MIKEIKAKSGCDIRTDKQNSVDGSATIRIGSSGMQPNLEARRLCQDILPNIDFSPGSEMPKNLDTIAPLLTTTRGTRAPAKAGSSYLDDEKPKTSQEQKEQEKDDFVKW